MDSWVWQKGLKRVPSTFLERKRGAKWAEILDLCVYPAVGTREGDGFLDVLFVWESQGRGEVELGDCMSKSWSLGLSTCMILWLYMCWISTIDCMWVEFPL